MGAKRLKQEQCDWETEHESFGDPDYKPSAPKYSLAKKRKTNRRYTQLKCKTSDITEKSSEKSGGTEKSSKKSGGTEKSSKKSGGTEKSSKKSGGTEKSSEKSGGNGQKKKTVSADLYNNNCVEISVLVEVERTLASLQNEIPHFVKRMLPSNVEGGFWMHIPRAFCKLYLPNHDSTIVLVDELGNECETTFILASYGLSGGWCTFSNSHRLKRGEILIFKLFAPCKIKVHIVRVPGPDDISAATAIVNMSGSLIEEDDDLKEKCEWKLKMLMKCVPLPLENQKRCIKSGCRLCLQR